MEEIFKKNDFFPFIELSVFKQQVLFQKEFLSVTSYIRVHVTERYNFFLFYRIICI